MATLRPPLPPPLSHEGIEFVAGSPTGSRLSHRDIVALAYAVNELLPPGDLVSLGGSLTAVERCEATPWTLAARLEAIDKGF